MAGNADLNAAARAKKDEFYTQLTDIERELRHYRRHFKGKTVLCNCDDPFESNFFRYFALNFNKLGLKKLIATSYAGSPIAGTQMQFPGMEYEPVPSRTATSGQKPYKAVVTRVDDVTGDGAVSMLDVAKLFEMGENSLTTLEGDGDFRSRECLELLDEADIVCTNPPFSLFREYIRTLYEHAKSFLIIGNQNAIKYKEVFPLFQSNKLWLGYGFKGNVAFFDSPYEDIAKSSQHIEGLIRVSGVMWYTNLDIKLRHESLILYRHYNPDIYPSYVNYPAINVERVADIPCDYSGLMGVPITFMTKYNPEQFEICGCMNLPNTLEGLKPMGSKWVKDYFSQGGTGHVSKNMLSLVYYTPDGLAKRSFDRIIIRNRHPEVIS